MKLSPVMWRTLQPVALLASVCRHHRRGIWCGAGVMIEPAQKRPAVSQRPSFRRSTRCHVAPAVAGQAGEGGGSGAVPGRVQMQSFGNPITTALLAIMHSNRARWVQSHCCLLL